MKAYSLTQRCTSQASLDTMVEFARVFALAQSVEVKRGFFGDKALVTTTIDAHDPKQVDAMQTLINAGGIVGYSF